VFQAIGAEYGEGFETFRPDGPLKVDVVRNFAYLICVLLRFFLIYLSNSFALLCLFEHGADRALCTSHGC